MKGRIVRRNLRRGTAYESYVWFNHAWVYLGRFPSTVTALQAQAQAAVVLQGGGQWTPPTVQKGQVGCDGIRARTLVDGAVVFDISVSVHAERRVAQSFLSYEAALAARMQWLDHINQGDYDWRPVTERLPKQKPLGAELKMDPPPTKNILFVDYAYRWFLARKDLWAKRTLYEYRSGVSRFLNLAFPTVPVHAIDDQAIMSLEALMASNKITLPRRAKIRRALAKILHSSITDGLRQRHPATYEWCKSGKVAGV